MNAEDAIVTTDEVLATQRRCYEKPELVLIKIPHLQKKQFQLLFK